MKKIKLAIVSKKLDLNGISSVIMNYYSKFDMEKFDITIFAGEKIDKVYEDQCKNLNIKLIKLSDKSKNKFRYYKDLFFKLKRNEYDIIHVHGNSAIMAIDLLIGYIKGIKIRIAHSHNTKCNNYRIHKILYPLFKIIVTDCFACGYDAGKWLFEENRFLVIQNGIDFTKFKFDINRRTKIREFYKINDNDIVLGHVGCMNEQKNQEYLIDIFNLYNQSNPCSKLIMIGNGSGLKKINEKANLSKCKENIIIIKETTSIEDFYMAMDVFVFPSRYEGLPVTLLESQISGLPCIISDVITDEAIIHNFVRKCSINDDIRCWIENIEEIKFTNRYDLIFNENHEKYNIEKCVEKLEKIYIDLYEGRK